MAKAEVQLFEDEFPLTRSCPQLDELRNTCELTDLTIQLKEDKFLHVHRLIVACRIPLLRVAMTGAPSVLQWPTVSIESASTLIDYLYTGRIEITCTNAMNMILLAKQLSLPYLEDWAATFLSARLHNNNISECWNFAEAAKCASLREACVHHMKAFFVATVASGLFLELPADVVLSMLRDDDLQVDSEEKVFDAIHKWVRPAGAMDEGRLTHAPEMLREVRWNQTKHSFRRRLLESDDLIVSSTDCMQCVGLADHWIGYSVLRNQGQCPFNASPRPASLAASVLIFGKSAMEELCALYQYDLDANTCEELSNMEGLQGARFLAHDGSVFVIGGRIRGQNPTSRRVDEYRTRERKWRKLPDLQNPREDHAAAIVSVGEHGEDSLVFVCGGRHRLSDSVGGQCLRSCELFDLRNNRWHKLPEPREDKQAPAVVALSDGRVFLLGGWNGKSCLASVEVCHLRADWSRTIETTSTEQFWRPLEPMRTPRFALAAETFRGKIIVAGGYTNNEANSYIRQCAVEVFSPPDDERPRGEWTRVADLLEPRAKFTLLVYKDGLYALGGAEDHRNTIEEFVPGDPPAVAEDFSSWSWAALDSPDDLDDIYGAVVV